MRLKYIVIFFLFLLLIKVVDTSLNRVFLLYTPVYPSLTIYKWGSKGVKMIWASEHDVIFHLFSGVSDTVKRLGRSTKLAELGL